MAIKLFEHNRASYESALSVMNVSGKAAVIHPTGTGKSFIGFKYAEDHPNRRVLWLTPSDYIVKTQLENLKNEGGAELENVTFITYAKLMLMTDSELSSLLPDTVICDEYHRIGAEKWQEGFERLTSMYPDAQLLGLSATNIRYLDNQRNMADELFGGNIASEMTLGEAIALGILPAPKYVISVFAYQKELRKYEDRIDKLTNTGIRDKSRRALDELRRTLEMADGLDKVFKKNMTNPHGKYIAFCANVEHMREMLKHTGEWFGAVDPQMKLYEVYSDEPSSSAEFKEFKEDNTNRLRILFCIDMLNEGVHVDDIDGVILLRPTVSPIIYKQQIGRALAAGKKKTPVIFDIVNNFENLCSIGTIQDEINIAVSYYRDLGKGDRIVTDSFEITDETKDSKKLFDMLESSLSSTWDTYCKAAEAYYEEHGDLNVPKKYVTPDGLTLGVWLVTQRRIKRGTAAGVLTEAQAAKLESIGMVWDDMRTRQWERGFEHAKAYFEENKNLDVKAGYVCPDGYKLGGWIANNRTWHANNSCANILTKERVKRLEEIGMVWSKNNSVWERYYSCALMYHMKHGSLDVPSDYVAEDGLRLGEWLNRQRRARKGTLTDEQTERLDMLGMVWEDKYERRWNEKYNAAVRYYKKHGNISVPVGYITEDGLRLGRWLDRQKRNDKLTAEQKAKLNILGIKHDDVGPWDKRFELAKGYYERHGDLNISQSYVEDNIWLGKWVYEQRRNREKLTAEQIKRLTDIGMDWRTHTERAWDRNYTMAQSYYNSHGNVDVPQSYKTADGTALGMWLYRQKKMLNKLSSDRRNKLKSVGIEAV